MKHVHPTVLRGAIAVRADGTNAGTVADQIRSALQEMKKTHSEEIANVKAGFDDVITKTKMEKIQTDLTDMTSAHDKLMKDMAAMQLGGTGDGDTRSAEEIQYETDFSSWFRTGRDQEAIETAVSSGKIKAATSVGSDEDGGFTAPVEWDRTITDERQAISEMRQYAGIQTVTGQGFTKLYNLHGTTSGWVGETAGRTETATPKLAPYSFAFGEIYANAGATSRLLQDSEIDIAEWLAGEVNMEFSLQEGVAFMTGNGSNKPKGFLMYDATAEAALAADKRHPFGPITEVDTGAAAALTADGLIDLVYDLPANRSIGAAFYANRKTLATIRKMKDGDGNFLWERGFEKGQPGAVLGSPIRELSGMPNVAADVIPVAFGNMEQTYRVFDRVGTTMLRDPYTNKPYVMFYTTQRVGGGLWNPEFMRYHRVAA